MTSLSPAAAFDDLHAAPSSGLQRLALALAGPRVLLRLEGAMVLALASWAFGKASGHWGLFAVLFLVPDLSMLGYLAGPRWGAVGYNLGHSYLGPAALALTGVLFGAPLAVSIALIWAAHIGFDRLMGYGLKFPTAFKHTHLSPPASKAPRPRA